MQAHYQSALSHYLSEYRRVEKNLPDAIHNPLRTLRQTAIQQVENIGFPTRKHPDWKYTSLLPFLQIPFAIAKRMYIPISDCIMRLEPTNASQRLVFINGFFVHALSQQSPLPQQAIVTHLANGLEHHSDHLFSHWEAFTEQKNTFAHLNTAFMQDGAYIYLPPQTQLTSPIELISITTDEQCFSPLRHIVIAEKNSRATIIEKYVSLPAKTNTYFTSNVTDCFLAKESHIDHYKYIAEGEKAIHISQLRAVQQEKSQFSAYSAALTGGFIRSDTHVKLCQAHAECHLKGLYYAKGKQHIDQQTTIEHASPQTYSKEFYKGIIDDHAHAVFNGKLVVHPKAIQSNAHQLNKNLLLSTSAEVYTKPQLEIFVDDIQCAHGASIGQLDETALFYLRTRGLTAQEARTVLINAFIHDIVQQMPLFNTTLKKFIDLRL